VYDNLWFATTNPQTRYLINEIVVAEESDLTIDGQRSSIRMYIEAMACGASTTGSNILSEVNSLKIFCRIKKKQQLILKPF
jgi:hypothetical protein